MTTENTVRSERRLSSRRDLFIVNILYSPCRFALVRAACVCTSWYFYVYRSLTSYYSFIPTNCYRFLIFFFRIKKKSPPKK